MNHLEQLAHGLRDGRGFRHKRDIATVLPQIAPSATSVPNGDDCAWDLNFAGDRVSLAWQVPGNDNCFGYVVGTYDRTGDTVTFDFEKERDYDVAIDQAIFADGMHKIG